MTSLLHPLDSSADAELIAAVRGGDTEAYGVLFERHVEAARRLSRQLVRGPDADDLVSEAFAKVLVVLQRGDGPDVAFRAYLLTSVRRLHVDRVRAASRVQVTDDLEDLDPGLPFRDTAVEGFENAAAARAFGSLPERWQLVLWHTEVEGQRPAEVAPLLGISANSVSALAYRAREGLRQAYLTMHADALDDDTCAWVHANLGGYVRGGLARRDTGKVEAHLEECRSCAAIYLELVDVNSRLGALLAPLLLGSAAAGYLASASGGAAAGAVVVALLDRAKDVVLGNAVATSVAGAAATAVIGGAVVVSVRPEAAPSLVPEAGSPDRDVPVETQQLSPEAGPLDPPVRVEPRDPRDPPRQRLELDHELMTPAVTEDPVVEPTVEPAEEPADESTDESTEKPDEPGEAVDTDEPDEPEGPAVDVAVEATAARQGGGITRIQVVVTGLPEGRTATLGSAGEGLVVGGSLDRRCRPTGLRQASCTVTGSPAPYSFKAHAPAGGAIRFTVTLDADGPADARPANNSVVVPIV